MNSLVKENAQVKTIKRQFHKINNDLAQLAQNEADLLEQKKGLSAKKKELTKSIDSKLKEIKAQLNKIDDKRIFTLGERNARLVDLKQLGLSKEIDAENKKASAHVKEIESIVTTN